MNTSIKKNQRWVAALHQSIDRFSDDVKISIMNPAGKNCACDILRLCETQLDRKITSVQDLVNGWNLIRASRELEGRWQVEDKLVRIEFMNAAAHLFDPI